MKLTPALQVRMDLRIYPRQEAPEAIRNATKGLEASFRIEFGEIASLPKAMLTELHRKAAAKLPETVFIASANDPTIAGMVAVLSEIARSSTTCLSREQRQKYYDTLIAIYIKLPLRPDRVKAESGTLLVGIEREGKMLAERLGCLPPGHSIHPNTKRVLFEGGLLVGIEEFEAPAQRYYDKCVIIDGAIASGATLISMMEKLTPALRPGGSGFEVYSAHASFEGLWAIVRYARDRNVKLQVCVGHATQGLNEHYYAVQPREGNPIEAAVVVGDLGDTISPLA